MNTEIEKILEQIKDLANNDEENNSLSRKSNLDEKIEQINARVLAKTENQKLNLRNKLTAAIKHIIWFQLLFFNIVVIIIVLSIVSNFPYFKEIDAELSTQLFDFLKYYIGATIVELLGMLMFVLRYLFSDFKFTESLKNI